MKSQFPTRFGITLAVTGGLVLGLCTMAFRAQADEWNKKTVLTVDQPIQVQDTYLEPGTYVFKLLDSSSNRDIVQIYNSDENHLINTIMAIPNYRLQPTGNTRFTFYETPPGTARAMHAWFYPGDNFGQEFRYPKQLHQLVAQVTPAPVVTRPPEPPPPPIVTQPAQQEPAPAPQATAPEQPRQEETVIAQNNPPPAPEVTPAPEPQPQPTQLPQTATPYPLLGLLGLISLAGYALLRVKSMT
jgi:outer membrane biosynthesis protein TonB